MTWVLVGRLGRPHGIRGGLRVFFEQENSEILLPKMTVRVGSSVEDARPWTVRKVYGQGDRLELEGLDQRQEAERFCHQNLYVHREDFAPLNEDELYLVDFVDAEVVHVDGSRLGQLVAFGDNGAQPLADIKTETGQVVTIPFVPGIVVDLCEDKKQVTLDPPEGFFSGEMVVAASDASPNAKGKKK